MNIFYFTRANLLNRLKPTTRFAALAIAVLLLAACGGGGSGGGGSATNGGGVFTYSAGNVTSFPDDGAVLYALNITRQNLALSTSSLNVTATITDGNCNISPDGLRILNFNTDNQASNVYEISYTGTTTVGGSCDVSFTATEYGLSETITRRITFNAEMAPSLGSSLAGDATGGSTNVPADQEVQVDVTATKQDNSNGRDVTFSRVITSSSTPSCTATLIGDSTSEYDGVIAGTSTAVFTYNVSSTGLVPVADCGTFPFNVIEGSATANRNLVVGISFGERNDIVLDPTVTTVPAAAITGAYPDDGASYTLNIARNEFTLPNLLLNVTAAITGTCSITQVGPTELNYEVNNQASTRFNIIYNGTDKSPDGDLLGGICAIEFQVVEAQRTVTLSRSITFIDEQAPILVASLSGMGENIPASSQAILVLTATKQDAGASRDITFLDNIVSTGTPSCTATLADASAANTQYSFDANNDLTAVATYSVRPTITTAGVSNCGDFSFNAIEGSATESIGFSEIISFFVDTDGDGLVGDLENCPNIANVDQIDTDGDSFGDACDVDDDGNGLIEIRTAAQLNMMRHNLAGANLTITAGGAGNSMGCGGVRSGDASACNGYEQMVDINLNDLPDNGIHAHNWEPVGTCGAACATATNAQLFSGIFTGNNFTISNMLINVIVESYGVGFFGAISPTAEVRDVLISSGNITANAGVISQYVGGLVGWSDGAIVSNSLVTLDEVGGGVNTGGLVGRGSGATIINSAVDIGSIRGTYSVGGLVGDGDGAIVSNSAVDIGSISGTSSVGGLVGDGDGAIVSNSAVDIGSISGASSVGGLVGKSSSETRISSSVATVGVISGSSQYIGGLLGFGNDSTISSSAATVDSISGTSEVGGLVGFGDDVIISSSVATAGSISGTFNVGGLVGRGADVTIIRSSVATADVISGTSSVGGLLGSGSPDTGVSYSLAITHNINVNVDDMNVGGLIGRISSNNDPSVNSYWDFGLLILLSGGDPILNRNTHGTSYNNAALRQQTSFVNYGSIYATWADAHCNPNTGEYSATAPSANGDYVPVWNLGSRSDYPAINCIPTFNPGQQRAAGSRALAGILPLIAD